MYHRLVNHNDDIRRLVEKKYAIAFDSNCLIVRDIPYLDSEGSLHWGAIVTKLTFTDQEEHVKPEDHQIFFAGSVPHGLDHDPIPYLGGSPASFPLSDACKDVVVQRSFSNKPKTKEGFRDYIDFFEKVENYVAIISGPAMNTHNVTPYTCRAVKEIVPGATVFKIPDTLSSRAEIMDLATHFKDDVIAIIGLGGTGSYILDYMVKTPVREIRAFDKDPFYVHNAFRSPGKLDLENDFKRTKAEVYQQRYENFRHGLSIKAKYIDSTCIEDLKGVTFAFVCVDKGSSRAQIFDLLISNGIPFIDVGMDFNRKRGSLNGMIRATYYSKESAQKLCAMKLAPLEDIPDDIYETNIQTAELNALNACLAVVKFKQLRGYYFEESPRYNFLFTLEDLKIASEDKIDED